MRIHTSTQKIVAGLLSFAMVLTLVVGLSVASANAQTVTYSRNLTVGSRGTDVTSLQTLLAAKGFLMVEPTGYFGSLTKAALSAWQSSVGISPASGYFGPITRAYVATAGGVSTVPGTTVPGCSAGALFSSTTGAPCSSTTPSTGGTLDNTDGSLTAAASTAVSSTVTIKKGETKDLIAEQFTATAGKVSINRFDVQFSERPWLTFNKFQLVDTQTGVVVATKNVSGASDFTEITAGTSYLLRFEGLNYVVTPGGNQTLKVVGTLQSASDKITGQTVTVTLPTTGVRFTNGKGFTDSVGPASALTSSVTLSSSGSAGTISARIGSGNSARSVQTASTTQTNNVTLMTFDLKSESQASTINSLNINLGVGGTQAQNTVFKNVRLVSGGTTINAATIATTTQFNGFSLSLPVDQWVGFSVVADVAAQNTFTAGTVASTSLVASSTNPSGIDSNYNTLSVNSTTVTGANVTLTNSAATITNMSASQALVNNGTSASTKSLVTFKFDFNNTSSNVLYLPKDSYYAIATSTSPTTATTTASSTVTVSGDTSADTTQYWAVQANSSRTFTYQVLVSNTGNAAANVVTSITAIYFADDTTSNSGIPKEFNINYGLDALKVSGQVF